MNGFIAKALAGVCLVCAVAATGCVPYRNWVDPCYPQRYNQTARHEVVDAFAPQVQNGHVLDQTVFNYHFDRGTDKLNPMGLMKLNDLMRRRPQPDPNIFLATANDVTYNPENPEGLVVGRRDLDLKRVAAIQLYLKAQMAGRPMPFEVLVHDPYEVGGNGTYAAGTMRLYTTASGGGPMGNLTAIGAAGGGMGVGGNQTGQFGGQGGGGQGQGSGQGSSGAGSGVR